MKNKIIKISLIAIACIAVITAGIILITSLTGLNAVSKNISASMQSVKTVTSTVTVTDGEQAVYKLERKLELDGNEAFVIQAESVLNSSFELARQPETQTTKKVNRDKLFNIDIKSDGLKSAEYKNGTFTAKISAEEMAKLFGDSIKTNGDANLSFTIKNKQITTLTLTFSDVNGKAVELVVIYEY